MLKEKIIRLLQQNNIQFEYSEHEETPTSQDSARIRGTPLEQGVKAIILKNKKSGDNYMVCISGHLKIDFRAVEKELFDIEKLNRKPDLTFENPDTILKKYKVNIGGVPPFGELMGLITFYDEKIFDNELMDFSCGERTASIEMQTLDYKKIIDNSKIGQFSKEVKI